LKYKQLLQKSFSRRAALIAGGKFVLISALISRMYYLQVIRADHYKVLSDKNRFNLRVVLPHRGQIFDRWGRAIENLASMGKYNSQVKTILIGQNFVMISANYL
jgi:cell division protein FtsI/penicillin-binding protein 2